MKKIINSIVGLFKPTLRFDVIPGKDNLPATLNIEETRYAEIEELVQYLFECHPAEYQLQVMADEARTPQELMLMGILHGVLCVELLRSMGAHSHYASSPN